MKRQTENKDLVLKSLMWSFLNTILSRYQGKGIQSLRELYRLLSVEFHNLDPKYLDYIEELKVNVWTALAEKYKEEIVVSLPQLVEGFYWRISEPTPQLTRWVNSMALKVEYGNSSIKLTNKIIDETCEKIDQLSSKSDEQEYEDWVKSQQGKTKRIS